MGAFRNLKLIKDALSPGAIKQGLAASRAAMSGSPAGLTDEQVAALPPEQRAAYEQAMAEVARGQAEAAAAHREVFEREIARRALYGPAGEYVYGPLPPEDVSGMTVEDALAASKEQLRDVLRNPLRAPRPQPPPTAPSAGAADRDAQAAAERAARDAARAPYAAPAGPAVAISRLATRERTQLEEVAAYLGQGGLAARPELVYGVYRVPDHIGGGMIGRGGSRVVEWDVVHAAGAALPQASPAAVATFDADERWVARRDGEPAVLDEDLALAYLGHARIGPDRCLGIARLLEIAQRSGGGSESSPSHTVTRVSGMAVFHPAEVGAGALAELRATRPLAAPPATGVHVEVLNWRAVARAVAPEPHRLHPIPSPFPHLPSTPQELLRAYVEIVGVRSADSYAAQVTEDRPRDLNGVHRKGVFTVTTNRGEEQPCADGEMRPRLMGGARVVLAYRDSPEYAEGRARFAAYERDVLDAALAHGTDVRAPVEGPGVLERGALGRLVRGAENVYDFVEGTGDDPFEKIPPYRYCWPPAG